MELARLETALGHAFRDRALLSRALTHRSAGVPHNERLEFLGDALLGYVVARRLFEAFPDAPEKDLTLMRAGLVRNDALAEVARELGLGEHVLLDPAARRSGVRDRPSVLADTLEAVVGAVTLDGGVEAGTAVVETLFGARIALAGGVAGKDPKTRLQEAVQARGLALPEYVVEGLEGAPHARRFTVRCRVDALDLHATGAARTRREAEQSAAGGVLRQLT